MSVRNDDVTILSGSFPVRLAVLLWFSGEVTGLCYIFLVKLLVCFIVFSSKLNSLSGTFPVKLLVCLVVSSEVTGLGGSYWLFYFFSVKLAVCLIVFQ